jgi:transcriptional regulator NrdR family protein
VRFASVYRQFEDVRDFVDEVKSMPKAMSLEKGE